MPYAALLGRRYCARCVAERVTCRGHVSFSKTDFCSGPRLCTPAPPPRHRRTAPPERRGRGSPERPAPPAPRRAREKSKKRGGRSVLSPSSPRAALYHMICALFFSYPARACGCALARPRLASRVRCGWLCSEVGFSGAIAVRARRRRPKRDTDVTARAVIACIYSRRVNWPPCPPRFSWLPSSPSQFVSCRHSPAAHCTRYKSPAQTGS